LFVRLTSIGVRGRIAIERCAAARCIDARGRSSAASGAAAASPAEIVTSRRSRYLAKPVQSARGDREDAVE
jgi:hypothetical protein